MVDVTSDFNSCEKANTVDVSGELVGVDFDDRNYLVAVLGSEA